MSQILIGTSGYSYTEWVGPVYPEGTRKEEFLARYASLFPTVELNFSYYKMPTAGQLSHLAEQAGPSLIFTIKANESLTHKIDPAGWRESAHTFQSALEPLRKEDRLGAVLIQFPYSFHYEPQNRRYLADLLSELAGLPIAVEFRCYDWYNSRVIDEFQRRKVALASLDLPGIKGLPPVMDVVTSPIAYVRFHGRNGETWWGSDSASRYDYLYQDLELETWADRIKMVATKADILFIFFNNHPRGQAVINAQALRIILERIGVL